MYFRNHQRRSKLEGKWKSNYRKVEKFTPVTFKIRSQLDGSEQKVYADHLRLAKVGDWNIPEPDVSQLPMRPSRKARFAVSPESTTSEDSESDAEPLFEATRHYRKERDSSSDEDDLPLMELRRRFRARQQRLKGRVLESERAISEEDVPVDKSADIDAVRCHRHRNSKDIFFTRGHCEDIIRLH